jgi:FlaA1/EpsC-like NDP-sugar epimerase
MRRYLLRLPQLLFHRRPVFIYIFQAILVFSSLILGWLLRFDFSLPYRRVLFTSSFLLVAVRLITLRFFKLNHGWWHFASVSDALNILKAVTVGSFFFLVLNRYLLGAVAFPRSVYVLEAVLTGGFLAGARLCTRTCPARKRLHGGWLRR